MGGGHRSLRGTPPQLGECGHTARGYCRAAAPLSFARLPSSLMLLFKTTMPFLRWRRRLNYKDDYRPNRSSGLEDPDVDHTVLNSPKTRPISEKHPSDLTSCVFKHSLSHVTYDKHEGSRSLTYWRQGMTGN